MMRVFLIVVLHFIVAENFEIFQPNILIILVDDMGYNDVGFQGSTYTTPSIDSLRKNGIRFTNGYVTAPQCSPSRAAILTGVYQQRFGHETNDEFLMCLSNKSSLIIPQYLKAAGYTTGMFGKWNLGDRPNPPSSRGFDESYGYFHYEDETDHGRVNTTLRGNQITGRSYATSVVFEKALTFMRKPRSEPFFVYLAPMSPHPPLVFPSEAKYQYFIESTVGPMARRKTLAMIAELDDHVGEVLDTLRNMSLLTRTVVFFVNDNGGAAVKVSGSDTLNRPLRGYKGDVYDGGVRVAMVAQWLSVFPQNIDVHVPVSTLDLLPTILHLSRLDKLLSNVSSTSPLPFPRVNLDGHSILPLCIYNQTILKQFTSQEQVSSLRTLSRRYLYWRFWMKGKSPKRAVRVGPWKWVRVGDQPDELYNITSDVGESRNLALVHPEVIKHIRLRHSAWESQLPILNRTMLTAPASNERDRKRLYHLHGGHL